MSTGRIKDEKIVKGARGIAEFAIEHIEDIKNGMSVDFAGDTPDFDENTPIKDYAVHSCEWYGIVLCETAKRLDSDPIVLYVDYYGGGSPSVVAIDTYDKCDREWAISDLANAVAITMGIDQDRYKDNVFYVQCIKEGGRE